MSDPEKATEPVDLDATPFVAPPIEGLPYDDGSPEDQAIKRILKSNDSPPHEAQDL